jgi:hypothetical protein
MRWLLSTGFFLAKHFRIAFNIDQKIMRTMMPTTTETGIEI